MQIQKSGTFGKQSLNTDTLIMKITIDLKTIVIILVRTEGLHIAYAV